MSKSQMMYIYYNYSYSFYVYVLVFLFLFPYQHKVPSCTNMECNDNMVSLYSMDFCVLIWNLFDTLSVVLTLIMYDDEMYIIFKGTLKFMQMILGLQLWNTLLGFKSALQGV